MSPQRQSGLLVVALLAALLTSAAFARPDRQHVPERLIPGATEAGDLDYPTLRRRIHERAQQARQAMANPPLASGVGKAAR